MLPSTVNLYYYGKVDKILGQRLREARALRAVTQEQLAARTVNTREAISMVERGRSGWALDKIAAAARALDVSSDFLLGLTCALRPAAELARELAAATAAAGNLACRRRRTGRIFVIRTADGLVV